MLYTPHPNAAPTFSALTSRTLPEPVIQGLVNQARAHQCTLFSVLYATVLLSTMAVRHTDTKTHLAGPSWLSPVNLRDRGILLQDRGVPTALGFIVVVPRDLARFVGDERAHKPATEDIWTLARELNEQMKEQQDEVPRYAQWGGRDMMSFASPESLQLMATYVLSPRLYVDITANQVRIFTAKTLLTSVVPSSPP